MKKEAKVEFGITITKPWSSEMYAHNEQVADIVRNEVEARWIAELMKFQEELSEEFMSDTEWSVLATAEMKEIQRAITCYGFGFGYTVEEVAERVMQELEDAPTYRLKEIAEDLEIELEKGFVGFNQPANFFTTKLQKDQEPIIKMLIFNKKKEMENGFVISARRAKAHLKELMKGTRADGMGAFTSKIYAKQMDGTIYRLTNPADVDQFAKGTEFIITD